MAKQDVHAALGNSLKMPFNVGEDFLFKLYLSTSVNIHSQKSPLVFSVVVDQSSSFLKKIKT